MSTTEKPGRATGLIGGGALAVAIAVVIAVVIGSLLATGTVKLGGGNGSGAAAAADMPANCSVMYYALDPNDPTKVNPAKLDPSDNSLVAGAIGTPVTARDEKGIKAELDERRECGTDGKFDPELTATHYADWSNAGLTKEKLAYADIDAFVAKISADHTLYSSIETELKTLENASAFSIEKVPAGIWSVYALPDGKGGLTTHVGTSAHAGTAAVFTHGDKVIKYRLECGFQILHQKPPKGLPQCTTAECAPTPPPATCEQNNSCTPVCPPGQVGTPPNCLTPKDPKDDVASPQGTTKLGADPVQPQAPAPKSDPVKPSTPVTQDPGPSVPVTGANPAPAAPAAPTIPQAPAPTAPGTPITDPDG